MLANSFIENDDLRLEFFPVGALSSNCTIIYFKKSGKAIAVDVGHDKRTFFKVIEKKKLEITFLIFTHAHFDHIGDAETISKECGAPILIHKDEYPMYRGLPSQGFLFGTNFAPPAPLDRFLSEDDLFIFKDQKIHFLQKQAGAALSPTPPLILRIILTPGHTPGHCCFYLEGFASPILISGDTLFYRSIGRTDVPGGDYEEIQKSITEKIYTLPENTLIVTGHGNPTNVHEEKMYNPYVRSPKAKGR